ncbi:MAG: preprotein translocase subunit YajC [Verrucomicrobiota bacterium]|jgi:preprotein translocase subunit YajC
MISLFHTLAQTTAPQKPEGFAALLARPEFMIVIMIIMFYFLLIRPQQRQRKEQAARVAALKSGDKVITTAGLHGIVHSVKDTTVMVKVAEGTILEFDKPAIASVTKKEAKDA